MWWALVIITVGAANLVGAWLLSRSVTRSHRLLVLVARFVVPRCPGPVPPEIEELINTYVGGSRRATR